MIVSVTVLVVALVSVAAFMGGRSSVALAEQSLLNAAKARTKMVSIYMQQMKGKMRDLASHNSTTDAAGDLLGSWRSMKDEAAPLLRTTFIENNPHPADQRYKLVDVKGQSFYFAKHANHQANFTELLGDGLFFRDILFINKSGDIYYSYLKGEEFTRNIGSENVVHPELKVQLDPIIELASSGSGEPYKGDGFTGFVDVDGRVTAYMVAPIYKWNQVLGAVAFEINTSVLVDIMSDNAGLGETGNVDLVSAHLQQVSFKNNFIGELPNSVYDISLAALKGEIAADDVVVDGEDYRAIAVPMSLYGTSWAVVAEQKYSELMAPSRALTNSLLAVGLVVLLVMSAFGVFFVRRSLASLQLLNKGVMQIAQENYAVDLPDADSKSEIGELSQSVAILRDNALERRRLEEQGRREQDERVARQKAIEALIEEFRSASSGLLNDVSSNMDVMKQAATKLSGISDETAQKATSSVSASEEASSNVKTVATAAEQLSSSIDQIKRQVGETASVVDEATDATRQTTETVSGLSQSAQKIGDVISLIQAIAEQTNLLALNATIEAARAGDHGKGFAVVASEVKELANQTSKATEEISSQIQAIQGATDQSVHAIQAIAETMEKVNDYTRTIAQAVEEQGAATFEISHNVTQAASGTMEVASNMSDLSQSVAETTQSVDQVEEKTESVVQTTDQLRLEVDRFLKNVANA